MEPQLKLHTYKSNIMDNMQRKHTVGIQSETFLDITS